MWTDDHGETTVSDRGEVTIPEGIRRRLEIDAGDRLRWELDDGELSVEIVHQDDTFEDGSAAERGDDALETRDLAGVHSGDHATGEILQKVHQVKNEEKDRERARADRLRPSEDE